MAITTAATDDRAQAPVGLAGVSRAFRAAFTEFVEQARRRFPTIVQPPEVFVSAVLSRLPLGLPDEEGLEMLRAPDLYLACACAQGVPEALAEFERECVPALEPSLARMGLAPEDRAEVKQRLRHRLFVGDHGGTGKIVDYRGRGDLRLWLEVTAVRTALDLMQERGRVLAAGNDEWLLALPAENADPELRLMKAEARSHLVAALKSALGSLSSRERSLLKYHFADALTVDDLAVLYHVHRATAARWLAKAQKTLVARTRKALGRALKMGAPEIDSLVKLLESQLHVSLPRVLRDWRESG